MKQIRSFGIKWFLVWVMIISRTSIGHMIQRIKWFDCFFDGGCSDSYPTVMIIFHILFISFPFFRHFSFSMLYVSSLSTDFLLDTYGFHPRSLPSHLFTFKDIPLSVVQFVTFLYSDLSFPLYQHRLAPHLHTNTDSVFFFLVMHKAPQSCIAHIILECVPR